MLESLELKQGNFFSHKLHIKVEGNKELFITEKRKFRTVSVQFPLEQISPQPNEVKEVSLGWALISAILVFVTLSWLNNLISEPKAENAVLAIIFSLLSLSCIWNTIQLSQNLLIYKNALTGGFLFAIMRNSPSKQKVDAFALELKKRIESFRTSNAYSTEDTLTLYTQHLNFLLQEEVLTNDEYSKAINRLSEKFSKKNILNLVR